MIQPTVLVIVEGGIARTLTDGDVHVEIIDWDVVDESTDFDEVYSYVEAIARLPKGFPHDRDEMLTAIEKRLTGLIEAEPDPAIAAHYREAARMEVVQPA